MDLALLIANETADCVIKDPYTDDDTDIVISVYGPYSKQYAEAFKKESSRKESDALKLLIDLTVGWVNLSLDGEDLPFNIENAKKIYSMDMLPVRRQVEMFILEQKNFLPKR
jgi:hypothetical protein